MNMAFRSSCCGLAGLAVLLLLALGQAASPHARAQQAKLDSALKSAELRNRAAAESQRRVEVLSDETERLQIEGENAERRVKALRLYNRQIEALLDSQQKEIEKLRGEIEPNDEIYRRLSPLLSEMVEALRQLLENEAPFRTSEREKRVADLRALIGRWISTAWKSCDGLPKPTKRSSAAAARWRRAAARWCWTANRARWNFCVWARSHSFI